MLIKMLTNMADPECSASAGQKVEVSADKARDLIEKGFAVPVKDLQAEAAMMQPAVETASPPPAVGRKSGKAAVK